MADTIKTEADELPDAEQVETPEGSAPDEPQESSAPSPEGQEPAKPADKAGREAAKYRRQLRDTEAERDGLRTSLDQARQQILDRDLDPAFRNLVKLAGRDISLFFTEDGSLNEETLEQTAKELHQEYPNMLNLQKGEWQKLDEPPKLQILRTHGNGAAAPHDTDEGRFPPEPLGGNTWQDAFTPDQ